MCSKLAFDTSCIKSIVRGGHTHIGIPSYIYISKTERELIKLESNFAPRVSSKF